MLQKKMQVVSLLVLIGITKKLNMKNLNKILILFFALLISVSCDTEGGIDDPVFGIAGNAPLAAWLTSAEGSDDLILSDPTSTVDFEIEFIDATDGSSVEEFTMTVTYETTTVTLISQSSFTSTSSGNQGFSGSFSLNDIASALGVTAATFSEGDEFSFSNTVTSGGTTYPNGNSNTFSNSLRDFDLEIPGETISITSFSTDSTFLNSTSIGTVVLAFANDLTIELETLPTVTRTSSAGSGDDVLGAVTAVLDQDGADSVYTFDYTPGAADGDTISFEITAASAVTTAGFEMADSTFSAVFIIDNVDPTVSFTETTVLTSGLDTTGIRFVTTFSEDIGSITMTANITGVDDDLDDVVDEDGEVAKLSPTFSGRTLDYTYPWTGADVGEVTIDIEMRDVAGNLLDLGSTTFTPD